MITLLLGMLAALIETVAFLIIYGLSLILNGQKSPFWLVVIGFVVYGYAAATTEVERSIYLAAGQAMMATYQGSLSRGVKNG